MSHLSAPYRIVQPEQLIGKPLFSSMPADEVDLVCDAITDEIEKFCRRKFAERTHTEKFESTGTIDVFLRNPPVGSLVEIRRDGVAADLAEFQLVSADLGQLRRFGRWGSRPHWDREKSVGLEAHRDSITSDFLGYDTSGSARSILWEVDYIGGFDPIPADIVLAALAFARYRASSDAIGPYKSETIGDYSYTVQSSTIGGPESTGVAVLPFMAALARYKIDPEVR